MNKKSDMAGLYLFIIILCFLMIGSYRFDNFVTNDLESKNPLPSLFIPELPTQKGTLKPGLDLSLLATSTPEQINRGKEIYQGSCSSCHGTEGKGDGVAAAALKPAPRNFSLLENWTNGSKVSQIFFTLTRGVPGTGMPPYDTFSVEDRFALSHFVREFSNNQPKDSREDLDKLDSTFKIAVPVKSPGTVPVSKAIEVLALEAGLQTAFFESAKKEFKSNSSLEPLRNQMWQGDGETFLKFLKNTLVWKKGPEELAGELFLDPVSLGFKPSVKDLSPGQWKSIHNALTDFYEKNLAHLQLTQMGDLDDSQDSTQKREGMRVAAATTVSSAFNPEEMAGKNGCFACHDMEKKIVGPSYKEIRVKYNSHPENLEILTQKVRNGGQGVWGPLPMPPQNQISDGDLNSLLTWMISEKLEAMVGLPPVIYQPRAILAKSITPGQSGCLACHDDTKRVLGPSYLEVAEKYRNNPNALETLVHKVKSGGSGGWGTLPMPPQNQVTEEQVRFLLKGILQIN